MVKVRFDLEANVKRKIHYLKQHRSGASITYFPEENQLEYQDTIRGLGDFANYLRQFGRSDPRHRTCLIKGQNEFFHRPNLIEIRGG